MRAGQLLLPIVEGTNAIAMDTTRVITISDNKPQQEEDNDEQEKQPHRSPQFRVRAFCKGKLRGALPWPDAEGIHSGSWARRYGTRKEAQLGLRANIKVLVGQQDGEERIVLLNQIA
jgi:hypothetical protein